MAGEETKAKLALLLSLTVDRSNVTLRLFMHTHVNKRSVDGYEIATRDRDD